MQNHLHFEMPERDDKRGRTVVSRFYWAKAVRYPRQRHRRFIFRRRTLMLNTITSGYQHQM